MRLTVCIHGCISGGALSIDTKIVFDALVYQPSASRVESKMGASGFAAAISRQNSEPGKSTIAVKSAMSAVQSTGSPSTAAVKPAI